MDGAGQPSFVAEFHERGYFLVPNLLTMDEVEQRYIARVMEAVGGNKTLAAKVLGFDRKTLYRKLREG